MMMFFYFTAIFFFLLVCMILCFVILIQEGKSGGGIMGMAGAEAGSSLFGTSTSDVLKKFTGWLVFIFLASCVTLSFWTASLARSSKEKTEPPYTEEIQ